MADTLYRYPGAQPFRDDDIARRTFFGRDAAAVALANQILANRLVVVYAKSGVGKTSLLNAGVAPRLREAGTIPLFLRVNDIERDLLESVLDSIQTEATRQNVEYVPGDRTSLWSFFKSVQFWRGDVLLTPALVLDQFEELFTLQSEEAREKFLSELSYLVRGIAPPAVAGSSKMTDTPPPIHVVLSLREDFLGLLEEASDRIPQILDHRFRLAPLDRDTAADAITRPSEVDDPNFATKPFRLNPDVVPSILNYLTKSASGGPRTASRYVEPFHLQLVCQRIERIVAAKEKLSTEPVRFSLKDLGGEAALAETLAGFYEDAIRSLKGMRARGAARRMCEQYLISPEGRRLSVDERELQSQLKLLPETLRQLVDRRLLRTDRRADSTYYELSHDTLVQPVLASRRTQALLVGWLGVVAGGIVSFGMGAFLLFAGLGLMGAFGKVERDTFLGVVILAVTAAAVGSFSLKWFRAGIRTRRRYRRRGPEQAVEESPTVPLKNKVLGWASLVACSLIGIVYFLGGMLVIIVFVALSLNHGEFPPGLKWVQSPEVLRDWQVVQARPFVETGWGLVELATIVALGWLLFQLGRRMLWPHTAHSRLRASLVRTLDRPASSLAATLRLLAGTLALIVSIVGTFALRRCVSVYQGKLPNWLSPAIVGADFSESCGTLYHRGWDFTGVTVALFLLAAFVFGILLLRSGTTAARTVLQQRRVQQVRPDSSKAAAGQRAL